jgi:hypothetical protein
MFFTLMHFLDEGLSLFLVHEGKSSRAVLELEGMEEGAILVISETIVYFLVPDDSSTGRL